MSTENAIASLTNAVNKLQSTLDQRLFELTKAIHETGQNTEQALLGMPGSSDAQRMIKTLEQIKEALEEAD